MDNIWEYPYIDFEDSAQFKCWLFEWRCGHTNVTSNDYSYEFASLRSFN